MLRTRALALGPWTILSLVLLFNTLTNGQVRAVASSLTTS